MKPAYKILLLFSIAFIFSGCGTMRLVDNAEKLSEPVSTSRFFTVTLQSNPFLSFNEISESKIIGDSVIFSGNKANKIVFIGEIINVSESVMKLKPKEAEELLDMKKEGGFLIGGIIGAASGAAIAGDDFGGRGVALTLTGTAAGALLGYWAGSKIVLDSEKPVVTTTDLTGKSIEEKKLILQNLIEKRK